MIYRVCPRCFADWYRIIKDFYISEPREVRPRVFGMTASPIDAKVDVIQAASELESLLDCKIATTDGLSLAEHIKRPDEEILRYDALPQNCFETPLLQDLTSRFGHIEVFASTFQRAAEVARHLGRWCADSFLLHAFSPERSRKYSVEVEKKWHARKGMY